ncbi:metal-dependent hydrolase [Candidatus Micrarchaeota archaeon]|nr:metal-dependent hydrolase [Candidatus Micrarchaeota archaeon]
MNWYQHFAVSLAACHLLNVASATPWTGPLLAAAALGAWLPDVDHQKTRIFHFALAVVFALAFSFVFLTVNFPFSAKVFAATAAGFASALLLWLIKPRHRGVTHHGLAAAVFGMLVYVVSQNASVAVNGFLAYGMHLVADWVS